jgi:hypothetical protein
MELRDELHFSTGQPGITIQGGSYVVDLSKTELSGQVTPKIEAVLNVVGSLMRVKELRCAPEKIEVLIGRQPYS